jgi:hypothetical protein
MYFPPRERGVPPPRAAAAALGPEASPTKTMTMTTAMTRTTTPMTAMMTITRLTQGVAPCITD